MRQSLKSKLSSFIGIILLIAIIGFTVFINFFVEEPMEEIKEVENVVFEEEAVLEDTLVNFKDRYFTETELSDLWKLENIHTDSIVTNEVENRTYMKIYKELGFTKLNPFRDSALIEILGESEMRELFIDVSSKYTIYNGIISFKHVEQDDVSLSNTDSFIEYFEYFSIEYTKASDFEPAMREIAHLIVKYQIESITTLPEVGNFTKIEFKGGGALFLVKENAEIIDNSYKNTINKARYLNDSTKLVLPSDY